MIWLALLLLCASLFYFFVYKPTKYFKERGIAHISLWRFIGDTLSVLRNKRTFAESLIATFNEFPGERYYGTWQLGTAAIAIRDPTLLKQMAVKNFDHFTDHFGFSSFQDELLSRTLFSMTGNTWREMRATLSPAFTSSKMRGIYTFMNECAKNCANYFAKKDEDVIHVDMKDISTKLANDVIASAAFGVQCDSLANPKNEFYSMGMKMTDVDKLGQLREIIVLIFPVIARLFRLSLFPNKLLSFFKLIIKDTIKARQEKNIIRPDMIHLLLEARKGQLNHEEDNDADVGFATAEESAVGRSHKKKRDITDTDIFAQAMVFFVAGFDTTSSATCFMALELCKNPEIQKRLHEEIDEVLAKSAGTVTYENIVSMKYLDQVLSETLRMWTPAFQIDRVCTKDYIIQPEKPHEKPYLVKKGQSVLIPIAGIHYDPQNYENPYKFDPERFSDENKSHIVPGSYNPFGIGPRNCIGSRFALLEIKLIFFHLLSKFEICFTEKTQLPIKLENFGIEQRPKGGFQMGLKKRQTIAK